LNRNAVSPNRVEQWLTGERTLPPPAALFDARSETPSATAARHTPWFEAGRVRGLSGSFSRRPLHRGVFPAPDRELSKSWVMKDSAAALAARSVENLLVLRVRKVCVPINSETPNSLSPVQ